MNRGLIIKSYNEIRPVTLGFGLLLFIVSLAIAFVSRQMSGKDFGMVLQLEFVQRILSSMLGTPVTAALGKHLVQALPWIHPVVGITLLAHTVTVCTQMPVGEIDRGTIDPLMGLPVSRWQIYASHALAWSISVFVMLTIGLAGNWCGTRLAHDSLAAPEQIAAIFINAFAMVLACGAFGYFVSSLSERRGKAVGIIVGVIAFSSLLNVVASAWPPAKFLNLFSVNYYYTPIFILRDGIWPIKKIAVLFSTALIFWIAGGMIFHRRDLHTL